MSGSSLAFAIRSILFSASTTGTRVLQELRDVLVAVARAGRRVVNERHDVHFAQRLDRGVDHPDVHPVQRPMDAGRVDEDNLRRRR